MRCRLNLPLVLVMAAALLCAAAGNTLDDVVKVVRDGLEANHSDEQIARALHRLNLELKLDDRTSEELESLAPGPKSIAELERLREKTSGLPAASAPPLFPSPPLPKVEELREVLSKARIKALQYTANLPDFLCTETVHRYVGRPGSWESRDALTVQLTYFEHREKYALSLVNGKKTSLTYDQVGGARSEGEFGSMLYSVFDPMSHTLFKWQHWTTLRKRPAYVLSFQIAQKDSNYHLSVGRNTGNSFSIIPGEHGFVYIDKESQEVMRIDSESDSIPDGFPLSGATRRLDYGPADVNGRIYLLPLRAEIRMIPRWDRFQTRNDVEFSGFRKFAGESTISFGDPDEGSDKTKPNPVKK